MTSIPAWIEEALRFPIGFAQVREDPRLDLEVLEKTRPGARVLMVASGGCTAAALAACAAPAHLHIVDPNPAQIALSRIKLALVAGSTPQDRLAWMGHFEIPTEDRKAALARMLEALELPLESLGPIEDVARLGPDHAGRYERLFAALRLALAPHMSGIRDLLELDDPAEQARRVAAGTPLGDALDTACETIFSLSNLVLLFGALATRNPRVPFARHFAGRLCWVLAHQGASRNPFLSQMLMGRFPAAATHDWLSAPSPARMPPMTWSVASMDEVLAGRRGDCDFLHLSNILDWSSPDSARTTLDLAYRALAPGGWIIVRRLNSVLDIEALGHGLDWDVEAGARLLREDRSFFYTSVHIGRKRA